MDHPNNKPLLKNTQEVEFEVPDPIWPTIEEIRDIFDSDICDINDFWTSEIWIPIFSTTKAPTGLKLF